MIIKGLYDGISCGMVAAKVSGLKVDKYMAYEIDEDAIKVSKHNHPEIIHMGDVFSAVHEYGDCDLLIGGSPCTYWSIANVNGREIKSEGLGWDLFNEYVRALNESNPKYFLYENNQSMKDDIKNEITKALGVEPIMINSADFSAQERKRYYWTNIPVAAWEPKNINFSDIMESEAEFIYRDISKYRETYKYSRDGSVIKWDTGGKGHYSQANRAKKAENKWYTVCASRAESKGNVWIDDNTIRLVTMTELERLQTLPDGYTSILRSKEKRGKGIGNGWTVDVIAHIFKGLQGGIQYARLFIETCRT